MDGREVETILAELTADREAAIERVCNALPKDCREDLRESIVAGLRKRLIPVPDKAASEGPDPDR